MSARFEELDWRQTPMGDISLRRRRDPSSGDDVYEIKLDDDFLMSSLFTAGEVALADRSLAASPGAGLDVVVGGLGLGYTARRVLQDARVRSLIVVEALSEVIEWHERKLLPLGSQLTSDPRCHLVHGDFFAMVGGPPAPQERPLPPDNLHGNREDCRGEVEGRRFDAVLLDIDHSPRHVLHPRHAAFYRAEGLRRVADRLHPGGVFALWSNDPPDEDFGATLAAVFAHSEAHVIEFDNPLQDRKAANTVYVASRSRTSG
jgi:spermidine synthase